MAGQSNGWKIFGIIVIVAAIVVAAFLVGIRCERNRDRNGTTSTGTATSAPAPAASPGSGGSSAAPGSPADGGAATTETTPGVPTVVSVQDTIGPCVGGFQDVTHTTTYSDGTQASSIARQPCDAEPDIVPVPGG